jgi:hypothetical protein
MIGNCTRSAKFRWTPLIQAGPDLQSLRWWESRHTVADLNLQPGCSGPSINFCLLSAKESEPKKSAWEVSRNFHTQFFCPLGLVCHGCKSWFCFLYHNLRNRLSGLSTKKKIYCACALYRREGTGSKMRAGRMFSALVRVYAYRVGQETWNWARKGSAVVEMLEKQFCLVQGEERYLALKIAVSRTSRRRREPWEELSFLLDFLRLYRGIGLTGDTVDCAAKHLTSWGIRCAPDVPWKVEGGVYSRRTLPYS